MRSEERAKLPLNRLVITAHNEIMRNLTMITDEIKVSALDINSVRICNLLSQSVQALTRSAFFMPTSFMVGCLRLFGAPFSDRYCKLFQSATLFDLQQTVAVLKSQSERTVMNKIPFFAICERTNKYQARRKLTEEQIIKAAKKLLDGRVCRGVKLDGTSVVKDYLTTYFAKHKAEAFICLFADNQNRLLKVESMFSGTINSASVYPREIARRCLELNAAAVIFAHNHPSGKTKPSFADLQITEKLKESLDLVGVRALDHFIVGGAQTYSFAESGLM